MRRNPFKWMVLGGILAIVVMYGIEMSSSGIERVYGPLDDPDPYIEEVSTKPAANTVKEHLKAQQQKIAKLERELAELKQMTITGEEETTDFNDRLPGVALEAEQPAVNRIADSTSGLLKNMSSEGIRLVVSLFDGLIK